LGDAAAVVGVAEEFIFCFHIAKANAAPTKAEIIPTTDAVISKIFSGLIGVEEGVGANDVSDFPMGGLVGIGVKGGVIGGFSKPAPGQQDSS
jgi:hypothetical protein